MTASGLALIVSLGTPGMSGRNRLPAGIALRHR